ncbi:zinc finger family protein [Salix suchowensis]|nr:zinc finger family protein [Salix suchowensis]
MGLSSFPSAAEGVLPVLVMNTVLSVAPLKNMVRSVIQVVGREKNINNPVQVSEPHNGGARRTTMECSVCLCGFESEEEVSELSCKHFFHRGCLDKWFDNKHSTCPLCRSNI